MIISVIKRQAWSKNIIVDFWHDVILTSFRQILDKHTIAIVNALVFLEMDFSSHLKSSLWYCSGKSILTKQINHNLYIYSQFFLNILMVVFTKLEQSLFRLIFFIINNSNSMFIEDLSKWRQYYIMLEINDDILGSRLSLDNRYYHV
jgi:hypothetical protein